MTSRSVAFLFTLGTGLLALGAASCSSKNEPSTSNGPLTNGSTGGATSSAGGAPSMGGASNSPGGSPAAAGSPPSMAGSPSGSGGASTTGTGGASTTSTGGTSTSTGGTSTAGSGGASTAGSGGASTAGSGGASTAGGGGAAGGGDFSPPCGKTAAGDDITKGGACTPSDTQLCYKQCGPINVGFKSETCMTAGYAEGDCQFPASGNYSCFKIPSADSSMCPADPPKHGDPCMVPMCSVPCTGTACEMCGIKAGYLDSKSNPKTGYCVCIAGANGNKWSCSSATAWPCPGGQGC